MFQCREWKKICERYLYKFSNLLFYINTGNRWLSSLSTISNNESNRAYCYERKMREIKLSNIEKAEMLILVDFSNLAYAAHYASLRDLQYTDTVGPAVFGAFRKTISQLKELFSENTALIFCLDEFPQHKRDLIPSYKANRKKLENDPRPKLIECFSHTRTYFAKVKAQEADDTIASICAQYKEKQIIIVSADQDLLQLKTYAHVDIYNLIKNEFYTKEFFQGKYGLTKWKFLPLYKACFGDASDNIKSALPRVRKNSITEVINKTDGKLDSFIKEFWRSYQSQNTKEVFNNNLVNLKLNYKIVKLNKKLKIDFTKKNPNEKNIKKLFKTLEIKSLNTDIQILL